MMASFFKSTVSCLAVASALMARTDALGINCRGSGLCPASSFLNNDAESVMEVMRHVVLASKMENSTTFNSGDHITCLANGVKVDASLGAGVEAGPANAGLEFSTGGTAHIGGICLFPQNLKQPLSLGDTKDLIDHLIQHGCTTCGSIPVHLVTQGNNDPGDGILTFNYVSKPDCVGKCIDPESPAAPSSSSAAPSTSTSAPSPSNSSGPSLDVDGASALSSAFDVISSALFAPASVHTASSSSVSSTLASDSSTSSSAPSATSSDSSESSSIPTASSSDNSVPSSADSSAPSSDPSAPSGSVPSASSGGRPGKHGHPDRRHGPMRRTPFEN